MRILYAVICIWLWTAFLLKGVEIGVSISDDTVILTLSIIAAGALAGGD